MSTGETNLVGDRQRIDRWIEESQYLIGRLIPEMLDEHERLRAKIALAEAESERLRQEANELRRGLGELETEKQNLQAEQTTMAEAFLKAMEHLHQMQPLLEQIRRRLQPNQSRTS